MINRTMSDPLEALIVEAGICDNPVTETPKCSDCGTEHPVVRYYWGEDDKARPGLLIKIPTTKANREDIYAATRALGKIGIHFDTGFGGEMDWKFDWSLSGLHYRKDAKGRHQPIPGMGDLL